MSTPAPDPRRPYKAYAAFTLTVLGLFTQALVGRDTFSSITPMEWFVIVSTVILTTGTVYRIENPATPGPEES